MIPGDDTRYCGFRTSITIADTILDSASATTLTYGNLFFYYDPYCFDHRAKEPHRQGKNICQRVNLEKMVFGKSKKAKERDGK